MQNFQVTINQLIVYSLIVNIVLSFLFGIFPLFLGIKLNNRKYGVIGFVAAVIGGGILGVFLSFPVAFIFTWLIIKNFLTAATSETIAVNEIPAESDFSYSENI